MASTDTTAGCVGMSTLRNDWKSVIIVVVQPINEIACDDVQIQLIDIHGFIRQGGGRH
jgi:hypothetical protein